MLPLSTPPVHFAILEMGGLSNYWGGSLKLFAQAGLEHPSF
jgi:hypothetical protein